MSAKCINICKIARGLELSQGDRTLRITCKSNTMSSHFFTSHFNESKRRRKTAGGAE
jgi:hypothetical protein